jgi:GalNAc5-diNAcBac-PP-undecaprenol beta-1,3-glucosyltransferase
VISVIMATYNREATLQRAIDSVSRQTYRDWELIIVDDGSTDETSATLLDIIDPRVKIYRHTGNRGVCAAKNTGFDHISGEWFTTLDSDDEMMPEALEVMLECAARTGATAVECNCVDSATSQMTGKGPTHDGWLPRGSAAKRHGDFWGLTRTDLLGDLRFDERLPGYEATVWLKIDQHARRYYIHRALLLIHTEGAGRVTKALRSGSIADKVRIFSALGEDRVYLRALRAANPSEYRRTKLRVHAARVLCHVLRARRAHRP